MPAPIPLDQILADLDAHGLKLVGSWLGTQRKTTFECKCGRVFDAFPNNIRKRKKYQCQPCSWKGTGDLYRSTLEEVRQAFIDRGATPLFTSYRDQKEKLRFVCATPGCEAESHATWSDVQGGRPRFFVGRARPAIGPAESGTLTMIRP